MYTKTISSLLQAAVTLCLSLTLTSFLLLNAVSTTYIFAFICYLQSSSPHHDLSVPPAKTLTWPSTVFLTDAFSSSNSQNCCSQDCRMYRMPLVTRKVIQLHYCCCLRQTLNSSFNTQFKNHSKNVFQTNPTNAVFALRKSV